MVSSHGERVTALDYHCRTIVLNQGPFCLSARLGDLAAAGAIWCGPISSIAGTNQRKFASSGDWSCGESVPEAGHRQF